MKLKGRKKTLRNVLAILKKLHLDCQIKLKSNNSFWLCIESEWVVVFRGGFHGGRDGWEAVRTVSRLYNEQWWVARSGVEALAAEMEREDWNFKRLVGWMDGPWCSVHCSGERERERSQKSVVLTLNVIN